MTHTPSQPRILLVCSSGGHLAQLYALKPWWSRYARLWITFRLPDAISLLGDESVEWAHHPTTRNITNLVKNLRLAWQVVRRERPPLILTTGAGVALPFFLVGKLFGANTAYMEVYDRIDTATLAGRLCYRLTDRFLLQWEEQRSSYPKGVVVGPVL